MSAFHRWYGPLLGVLCLLGLSACGEPVQIPNGYVGRQLSTKGLDEQIIKPGVMRLEFCGASACPELILLEIGLDAEDITVGTVFLPKSNVDLSDVKLAIQFRVRNTEKDIRQIYNEVPPARVEGKSQVRKISSQMLYNIYLKRLVPSAVIGTLRDYKLEETMSNVDTIAGVTLARLKHELGEHQPIEIIEVGFPNGIGKPADEVLQAKRQLFVVNENVTRQIRELEGQLEVEKQRQKVQQLRVANDVDNAKKAGLGVAAYMFLKNMERFADGHVPLGFVPGMNFDSIAKQ